VGQSEEKRKEGKSDKGWQKIGSRKARGEEGIGHFSKVPKSRDRL